MVGRKSFGHRTAYTTTTLTAPATGLRRLASSPTRCCGKLQQLCLCCGSPWYIAPGRSVTAPAAIQIMQAGEDGDGDGFVVRCLKREEMAMVREWAVKEQWNPGVHDWEAFFDSDPSGFFVGVVNDEPVAITSMVKYSQDYAFLGHYIVKPGHRGKGYGLRIWKAGMDHAQGCRSIGLDGVVAQQDNYKKSGFALAYRNFRFEGVGGGDAPRDPRIVPLSTVPKDALYAFDRQVFPAERRMFLDLWTTRPGVTALAAVRTGGGELAGYGVVRRSERGYRVGPLYADGDVAEPLYLALCAAADKGAPVFMDIPEANGPANDMAKRLGLSFGFETARMYAVAPPGTPVDRVFGVSTLELG